MANHKSALKRIRSSNKRRLQNRYQHKTVRNAIRDFKKIENRVKAEEKFPEVVSMIDKLSKKNVIHSNKASNLKSQLSRYLDTLEA